MRKTYDKEFKVMICELLLSGQSAKTVAEEYGVDVSTVRNRPAWRWKKLYKSNKEAFTGSGKTVSFTRRKRDT